MKLHRNSGYIEDTDVIGSSQLSQLCVCRSLNISSSHRMMVTC